VEHSCGILRVINEHEPRGERLVFIKWYPPVSMDWLQRGGCGRGLMVGRLTGRLKSSAHVHLLGCPSILWAAMFLRTDISLTSFPI